MEVDMRIVQRKELRGSMLAIMGTGLLIRVFSNHWLGWVALGVFLVGCAKIYFKVEK